MSLHFCMSIHSYGVDTFKRLVTHLITDDKITQIIISTRVCYRNSSMQPKYQTTCVNYTAYTITVCCNRTPHCLTRRIKSQICSDNVGIEPEPFAPAAKCVTTRPPRPCVFNMLTSFYHNKYY